jgi:hypothetical protein
LSEALPIHDLFIRQIPIKQEGATTRWTALQDGDHLLRRFGLAEVVRAESNHQPSLQVRSVADEVWALLEGQVEFFWHDLRQDSPTHGEEHHTTCENPTLVLAPFGVAFGFRALAGSALLLRLASHAEGAHDGDQRLPWEGLG